jgi:inosine-uridine nucleoside N-ribohydrolase
MVLDCSHLRGRLGPALAIAVAALWGSAAARAEPAAPPRAPVVLDTDIGTDVDDAFALALALASPELELRGVTTAGSDPHVRAQMVCRLLTAVGRRDLPVAAGRPPQPTREIRGQLQYAHHPAVIFNRTAKPVKEPAVEFLYNQLKARPGKLTLVATGPLTNLARLFAEHPDCKPWVQRIILRGGAVRMDGKEKPPADAADNLRADVPAARAVFAAGIPLVVVPDDVTAGLKLEEPLRHRLFQAGTALTYQVQALYQLWDQPTPTLRDPLAVALCGDERFGKLEDLALELGDRGDLHIGKGKPNAHVVTAVRGEEFLKWYVERVAAAGKLVPPRPPANPSKLVPRGGLPNLVHAFEDFETDIERRWWMSGKPETANVPPGSRRACRGVLTQDFDDLQGDMRTMYTAVIFNPVPGPPMGKHTRLSFRYWLKGTDTLRVQLYSLTNGYHRCLTLHDLPQGEWQSGTVDMTAARRPDGSGGPLSENERIDDIQFYTDPTAELLIDDIVLYDAAVPGEKRPFPKRFLFTGWFDTGRQGQEWPGTFAIVPKKPPLTWKAAQSVPDPKRDAAWIRLHLRGERPLGAVTHLRFRYVLTGAETMRVLLFNRTARDTHIIDVKGLQTGQWAETTLDFTADSRRGDGSDGKPRAGDRVDEIQFLLPKGAELLVDDVLLYEPGPADDR